METERFRRGFFNIAPGCNWVHPHIQSCDLISFENELKLLYHYLLCGCLKGQNEADMHTENEAKAAVFGVCGGISQGADRD